MRGEARQNWLKLVEDQPVLANDNYEVDNTHRVDIFNENQAKFVAEVLNEYEIESIKSYLQGGKLHPEDKNIE